MADDQPGKEFVAYIGVRAVTDEPFSSTVVVNADLEHIKAWSAKGEEVGTKASETPDAKVEEGAPTASKDETELELSVEKKLSRLMRDIVAAMSGYQPLIAVGPGMFGAMRGVYISSTLKSEAQEHLKLVHSDDHTDVYGISLSDASRISRWLNQLNQFDQAMKSMPGAILLSLVATFDSYMADTVRLMLKARPQKLVEDKSIAVKDILKMGSFDEVVDKIVDEEVYALMRGSHEDQVTYVEKNFSISIRGEFDRWPEFIEIFERRNLAAHGNLVVNQRYLSNCKDHEYKVTSAIGDKLDIDPGYLRKSSNLLTEFLVLLVFVMWRKNYKDDAENTFVALNQICFDLIKDKRPRLAHRLLGFALFKQKRAATDRIIKMMTVNYANALKKAGDLEAAAKTLDTVDWSALSDDFKICVASIREDAAEVARLMPIVAQADHVRRDDFREWPAFDWVRESTEFRAAFEETFGEPLQPPSEELANPGGTDSEEPTTTDDETLH